MMVFYLSGDQRECIGMSTQRGGTKNGEGVWLGVSSRHLIFRSTCLLRAPYAASSLVFYTFAINTFCFLYVAVAIRGRFVASAAVNGLTFGDEVAISIVVL